VSLAKPLAAEFSHLATETGGFKSDIVKEAVSQYLWEARFRGVRRQLIRRAKRTGVTAEADHFQTVSGGRMWRSTDTFHNRPLSLLSPSRWSPRSGVFGPA